jgi:hypothetical protein
MGRRPDLEDTEGYLSTKRVFTALGLGQEMNDKSAEPYEDQFINICDNVLNLTTEGLKLDLPVLVTDQASRSKVEQILSQDETQKLL